MRLFLNNYHGTQYDEISLNDMHIMLKNCTSKEDARFYIKHSSDDMGYMELPFNLGMKILSLLSVDTLGTIDIYPDDSDVYDYGFEIYIDF